MLWWTTVCVVVDYSLCCVCGASGPEERVPGGEGSGASAAERGPEGSDRQQPLSVQVPLTQ